MSAIFISHSSKNVDLAIDLRDELRRRGYPSVFLDVDRDDGILAGEKWESVLYRELRACQAVVALVGDDWLASRWCFAELSHAREKGKVIIGLQLAAAVDRSVLGDTQCIDFTPAARAQGYERLERGLRAALDVRGFHKWDATRSPYPGLLSFDEADAAVFFGRDATVRELKEKLTAVRRDRTATKRLTLVLGASGSGKSSLVRAGLLPLVKQDHDHDHWLALPPFRPGARPMNELAKAYSETFRAFGAVQEWSAIRDVLQSALANRDAERLRDLTEDLRIAAHRPQATLLLTIDQMEEALGPDEAGFLAPLFDVLALIVDGHRNDVAMIATLRSDFLAELQRHPHAAKLAYEAFHLDTSNVDFSAVIEGPARIAAIELQDGLADAMAADTGSADALPLLAFALGELWTRFGEDRRLTLDEYRSGLGGLRGSVARAAEQIYGTAALSLEDQAAVRRTFLRLVRVDDAGRHVKRAARWRDLPPTVHAVVDRFVEARLLVSRSEDGERVVEVAHDVLFTSWHTLAEWLRSDQPFLSWRGRLQAQTATWVSSREDKATLLRGNPLNEAEGWFGDRGADLSADESRFIAASIALRAAERAEAETREWTARLEAARAFYERSFVFSEQRRYQSAAACLLRAVELAPQNGAPESFVSSWGTPAWARPAWTQFKQLEQVRARRCSRVADHEDWVMSVAFTRDGRQAVTACLDGKVRCIDVESGEVTRVLDAGASITALAVDHANDRIAIGTAEATFRGWRLSDGASWAEGEVLQRSPVSSIRVSDDGNRLAIGTADGTLTWLDFAARSHGVLAVHGGAVTALMFSPDATTLFSASSWVSTGDAPGDGGGAAWRLGAKPPTQVLFGDLQSVTAIAIAPGGTMAIRGFESGATQLCPMGPDGAKDAISLDAHSGRVTCAAFSPDGRYVATGSADNTVRVWNVERRELSFVLEGHRESVLCVAFSRDGSHLVSGSKDRSSVVWDIRNARESRRITDVGDVAALAMTRTGDTAIVAADTSALLYDLRTGALSRRLDGHAGKVRSVGFSADGRTAITGAEDGSVRTWSVTAADEARTRKGHPRAVCSVVVSPDGETLLSGDSCRALIRDPFAGERSASETGAGSIAVWNANTDGAALLNWHAQSIACVAMSPDGARVATGSWDGTVRVTDARSGRQLRLFRGHTAAVFSVAFSVDGTRVVSGSIDRTARVWEMQTAAEAVTFGNHTGGVGGLAVTPDGECVLSASADMTISVWRIATGEELRVLEGHTEPVHCVTVSPDGRLALSGAADRCVMLWDIASGALLKTFRGHDAVVTSVAFDLTGTHAFSGGEHGALRVWNIESDEVMQAAKGTEDRQVSLTFAPDRRTVALAWDDGSIHLFELETLNQIGDFAGHKSHVPGVAFTPDGSTLASVDDDAMLVVWSVADQTPISVVTPAEADVGAVTLAADGATAMVGLGDATVRFWNLRTGEAGPVLEGHTSAVTSVATTGDARLALSASDDGTIRVWDLRAASQLRVLKGHAAGVTGVAFGPDAETAISASSDGTVRVWDIETGKQLRYLARSPKRPITMTLHSKHGTQLDFTVPSLGITGVAVAASGLVAATNWDDKTLLLWDLGDERAHSPPPAVSREALEPYREFESLYASVGMRVLRDGPNQGDIEVC